MPTSSHFYPRFGWHPINILANSYQTTRVFHYAYCSNPIIIGFSAVITVFTLAHVTAVDVDDDDDDFSAGNRYSATKILHLATLDAALMALAGGRGTLYVFRQFLTTESPPSLLSLMGAYEPLLLVACVILRASRGVRVRGVPASDGAPMGALTAGTTRQKAQLFLTLAVVRNHHNSLSLQRRRRGKKKITQLRTCKRAQFESLSAASNLIRGDIKKLSDLSPLQSPRRNPVYLLPKKRIFFFFFLHSAIFFYSPARACQKENLKEQHWKRK